MQTTIKPAIRNPVPTVKVCKRIDGWYIVSSNKGKQFSERCRNKTEAIKLARAVRSRLFEKMGGIYQERVLNPVTVKVCKRADGWYIVANFNGERKSHKYESEADAEQVARHIRSYLYLHILGIRGNERNKERILSLSADWDDKEFFEAFCEGFSLDFQIEMVEDKAKDILAEAGLTFPCNVPDTADPIIKDAEQVLRRIRVLRDSQAKGDTNKTALHSYFLGRFVEMMSVRSYEQYVQTGKIHKAKSSYGGKQRATNARERHLSWFQRAKELTKGGLTVESAAQRINKEEVKTYKIELDKWLRNLRMDPPAKPRNARTISKAISKLLKSEQQQSSRRQQLCDPPLNKHSEVSETRPLVYYRNSLDRNNLAIRLDCDLRW